MTEMAGKTKKETKGILYDLDPLLRDQNTSHAKIIRLVGENKRVLDVGCSTGFIAKVLIRLGCKVVGIESDSQAADRAKEYCEEVIVGDLEGDDTIIQRLKDKKFDVILMGDVLEHLYAPAKIVGQMKKFLSPEGYVVISVPNIAHTSIRLSLLEGRFDYMTMGLLDNSHICFFTLKSIYELLDMQELYIDNLERVIYNPYQVEVPVNLEKIPPEVLAYLENSPEAETYQYVLTAKPKKEGHQGLSYTELLEKKPDIVKETGSLLFQYKELTLKYAQLLANTEQKLRNDREYIDKCHKTIQEKDSQLKDKEAQIQERNTLLEEKDALIQQKVAQIREKDSQLKDKETQIQEKDSQLKDKETQIQEKEQKLTEIYGSLSWRTIRIVLKPYNILKSFFTVQKN